MAPPPKPPPPGYFERRDALINAKAKALASQLSTSLVLAPPPSALSYTDTIADVTPFIPITLDLAAHNYYHWCHLFEVHLGRCNLRGHIDGSVPPRPDDPQWVKDDLAIIQWIYTRVSTEIFNLVFRSAATASALWSALRQLFQDNVDGRVTSLNNELRNTVQGDTSISTYCQHLRAIADELRELGDPVSDRQLINILVAGLSNDFDKQASFIPMMRPRPTFAEVRSLLQHADTTQTRKAARPQAFVAAPRPPPQPPAPVPPPPAHAPQPPPGWRPSPNYRGKNPVWRPPRPPPPSAPVYSTQPAPVYSAPPPPAPSGWRPTQDPWTGMVQAWSMPWTAPASAGTPPAYLGGWTPGMRPHTGSPGLLTPRPPPQAYYAAPPPMYGAPSSPLYATPYGAEPPSPYTNPGGGLAPYQLPTMPLASSSSTAPPLLPTPTPTWDQAAFLQAMNNFAAQGNSGTDWIFDSGASSHMFSSHNMLSFSHNPCPGRHLTSYSFTAMPTLPSYARHLRCAGHLRYTTH
ncbi:hypothetical protein QYE76_061328 [Lolium multiflorum]|uniref:Uncharacterized protein n=1 Tax=Lolium multiflorum TaxID=4521 RepID=A0AAD8S204_LOLMU|nr:hypothetical protein QYE76_061328 [Lolium multiflorum]